MTSEIRGRRLIADPNHRDHNFNFSVDGNEVCPGRPQHILRYAKYFRAHRHVFLLHDRRHGTGIPEIHLVEEVSDRFPNGEWREASTQTNQLRF